MLPIDIATAVHYKCVKEFIPKGISPPHEVTMHLLVCEVYSNAVNNAGLNVTGEDVCEAIFGSIEWDHFSKPWPGHPHPDKVIEYLKAR